MSPFHLSEPAAVQIDGKDLTPYVESIGFDLDPWQERVLLDSFGMAHWTMRGELSPTLFRRITGGKHPRIAGLRRAYRAKRRHW